MTMNGPWKWSESGAQLLDNTGRTVLTIHPSDATQEEFDAVERVPAMVAALKEAIRWTRLDRDMGRITEDAAHVRLQQFNDALDGDAP